MRSCMRRSVSSGERISMHANGGLVSICSTGSSSETRQISGTRNFVGENANTLLREDFNIPFVLALAKPEDQGCLYSRMVMFTLVALLNSPIDKVTIRAIAAFEILAHRD